MTETKNKNGKSGVYQNDNNSSFLGLTRESLGDKKIPDQVGDDSLIVGNVLKDSRLRRNDVLSHTRGERGRSMVEMLGVLAVAGVLSIGGVAGYRYAMDKMNANDIINEVRKRAVTASQQRILGQNVNLSEYGDNGRIKGIHAVTVTNDYAGDKGFFALTVSNVPQRVCDKILDMDWAMPVEMTIGGVVVDDDTTCAEGENEMLFAFANTLDNSLVPGEGNGEENGDDEVDEGDDPWAQDCGTNEYHDFNTGECVVDEDCDEGEFLYGSQCLTCPDATNPVAGEGTCYEASTCEKCSGAQLSVATDNCGYYCVYCPDGVTCGDQCCGEGQMCQRSGSWPYTYTCVSALGTNECMTNDDCTGANQYCQNDSGCSATIGTCETISSTSVTINGKEYTASTKSMSYHAAENFCDALGKRLAPVTDGCTAEELATVKASYYHGSCSGWARTTGKRYWTSTKISGCSSYSVESNSSGAVGYWGWGHHSANALCR